MGIVQPDDNGDNNDDDGVLIYQSSSSSSRSSPSWPVSLQPPIDCGRFDTTNRKKATAGAENVVLTIYVFDNDADYGEKKEDNFEENNDAKDDNYWENDGDNYEEN